MKVRRLFQRFARDESGVAMILLAIMLPVIIGLAVLAVDMSRVNNLHNDLQEAADALSLTGASELDGAPFALNRARRAMSNLVSNDSLFSDAGLHTVSYSTTNSASDVNVYFLKAIPADDADPLNDTTRPPYLATGDADARFVEVDVKPTGFTTIFPIDFVRSTSQTQFNVSSSSVAGYGSGVCDFTPLFICNPYEGTGITIEQAATTLSVRRRQIQMRYIGNNAGYFPGNFGFLRMQGGHGANDLAAAIAGANPSQCFSIDGVDTETGQKSGPVKAAVNVRFGINEPGGNFASGNGADLGPFGPAQNVRRGSQPTNGTTCPNGQTLTYPSDPVAAGLMGLPRDPCFATNNCPYMRPSGSTDGRMGDGVWDLATYWSINHGGSVPADLWDGTTANLPSRYEVYRYEIANNLVTDMSTGGETGVPKSGCGSPVIDPDRRLIYGAILNCQALEDAGYNLSGQEAGLPVANFASFFITQPVKSASAGADATIYSELVDVTGHEGNGTLENFARDEAQLYR